MGCFYKKMNWISERLSERSGITRLGYVGESLGITKLGHVGESLGMCCMILMQCATLVFKKRIIFIFFPQNCFVNSGVL